MVGGVVRYNPERGPPKDHSTKVWSQLAKQFSEKKIFNAFFAEFSIFSHGGHLGWRAGLSDAILKGDYPKTFPPKFGPNLPSSFGEIYFECFFFMNFLFLAMAAILIGGRGRRIQS